MDLVKIRRERRETGIIRPFEEGPKPIQDFRMCKEARIGYALAGIKPVVPRELTILEKRELEGDLLAIDINGRVKHDPIVYTLWNDNSVKIGTTTNFSKRVPMLETGSDVELVLVSAKYGDEAEERRYHKLLEKYKRRKEWFRLSMTVWEEVEEIGCDGIRTECWLPIPTER